MKKTNKLKTKIFGIALLAAAPICAVGTAMTAGATFAATASNFLPEWVESQSLLDSRTFNISGTYQNTPLTGWTLIDGYTSSSKGMIIDIGGQSFTQNRRYYFLDNNPGKLKENYNGSTTTSDNKILMINSTNSLTDKPTSPAKRGYKSNEFTLEANSFYRIAIDAKSTLDGRTDVDGAYGSIYLSGLKDESGKEIKMAFEGFSGEWRTYYFYIATGNSAQNVTLDLYLGKTSKQGSFGAVFFDDINIEQYSQNAFIRAAQQHSYQFEDTNTLQGGSVKFLVDALTSSSYPLMKRDDYKNANFDFEKPLLPNGNGLTDEWEIKLPSNANAMIFDVQKSGQDRFEQRTQYPFVGNDLTYNMQEKKPNSQALALYTTKGTDGFMVVENTTPILVEAQSAYKITMNVKSSAINSGSFYVNLVETDAVLKESGLKKEDLKSGTSSAFTQNTTNAKTNDWTPLTYYVSGRTFYDSQVKLQLSLGNEGNYASGCVLVDNIKIEYATTEEASAATNYLNLQGDQETSYSDISNPKFDATEIVDAQNMYPLSAKDWTLTQEENHSELVNAGVVYLKDQATYEKMYYTKNEDGSFKYNWASSYPGSLDANGLNLPNNVYMMHNGVYSYQSIQSSNYSLSANSYYKLDFNYYNLSTDPDKDAQLTVELVDDNGIVLFKELIDNSHNAWNLNKPVNINIHTPLASTHKVSVKIHFGTQENPMIGTSYIDNVSITASDALTFAAAKHKVDMTDYMLNLDPDRAIGQGISSTTAYNFTVEEGSSNAARGGILNGSENEHGVTYQDKNGNSKNILAITSMYSPNTSSITSNFPFSLSSGSYYKLTFSFMTKIRKNTTDEEIAQEKDHKCDYGISIGLSNFELAKNLISSDEWTDYTIYLDASKNSSESNLQFKLIMDKHYEGSAYLTNIAFSSMSADEYKYEISQTPDKENVLTAKYLTETNDNTEIPDDSDNQESAEFDAENWLIIPSLITALAVLIAIVGWALRHVKIKKIKKYEQEDYVRTSAIDQEKILQQAKDERDRQAQEIKQNLEAMLNQKQILEDEHKLAIKDSRLSSKGQITKETEKEFKSYAARLTRLEQKMGILNEQLEKIESQDYLATLERQFEAEEAKRHREAMKAAKEQFKAKAKENKDK